VNAGRQLFNDKRPALPSRPPVSCA
jgi:hypothetical protein